MRILVCDIGNSSIKFVLYSDNRLLEYHQISHEDFSNSILHKMKFDKASISSVVPQVSEKIKLLLQTQFDIDPLITTHRSNFSLQIKYDSPLMLGIDRICGAEGAYNHYLSITGNEQLNIDETIMVIDCGTATTINIINSPNCFEGGIIAPGLNTMIRSLKIGTAQLPEINLDSYDNLIGKNTEACIASGIINSTIGLIEKVIGELQTSSAKEIKVYLTGGNAHFLKTHLKFSFVEMNDLVPFGIYCITRKYYMQN